MDVITYNKLKKVTNNAPEMMDSFKEVSDWMEENGGQVNWNQNDETKPDYIKNRICYKKIIENKCLQEQEVRWEQKNYMGSPVTKEGIIELSLESKRIVKNRDYIIEINGTQYPVKGVSYMTTIMCDPNGVPDKFDINIFPQKPCVMFGSKDHYRIMLPDEITANPVTISITEFVPQYKIIDPLFIPKAVGDQTTAEGENSHAEGYRTTASGYNSHAEGFFTKASGANSHAENGSLLASGNYSHTEGAETRANGDYSHAEGCQTDAVGENSHSENGGGKIGSNISIKITYIDDHHFTSNKNVELKKYNACEFFKSKEINDYSLIHYKYIEENDNFEALEQITEENCSNCTTFCARVFNSAIGKSSHVEGFGTIALSENQHVQGKFNIDDGNNKYANIIGNGNSNFSRSNAHTLDWNGNSWYQGNVLVGGINADSPKAELTPTSIIISSSTPDSIKKFKITVNDEGVITATPIV